MVRKDQTITEVKHGGCYDCGLKEQQILVAHTIPEMDNMTAALCDHCRWKRGLLR